MTLVDVPAAGILAGPFVFCLYLIRVGGCYVNVEVCEGAGAE